MRPCPTFFPNPIPRFRAVPFKKCLGTVSRALLAGALLAAGTWAAPETLTFVKGEAETLQVRIDYDKHPDIPSESGRPWEEIEKDSVYTTGTGDEATQHVRYVKAFHAEMNGRKGYGTDYIHFTGPPEPSADRDPVYTAELNFHFPDGSSAERLYNPTVHLNDFPRMNAQYWEGVALGTPFGFGSVGGSDSEVKLVARTPGWEVPVAAIRTDGPGGRPGSAGWIIRLDGRQALRVPEGSSRLRLIDVTGRSAWHAHGLRPGDELALPDELGPGAFRLQWIP